MTRDQANELRELAQQPASGWGPATKIAITAGKGGVGASTVAVNLAAALACAGRSVLLVDADLSCGGATRLCGLEADIGLEDVLSNRRSVEETLLHGPGGISVLPAAWATGRPADCPPSAQARLMRQVERLAQFDTVVLDIGAAVSHAARRFWQAADLVLLVSNTESTSIMASYAAIKALAGGDRWPRLATFMNRAPSALHAAAEAHTRLTRACHRFLGITTAAGGWAPEDPQAAQAGERGTPLALAAPRSRLAGALREAAQRMLTTQLNSTKGNADKQMDRQHGLCC